MLALEIKKYYLWSKVQTMHSSFDLSSATFGEVKQQAQYDWAILPWGSTEPHNGHLPYGTDVICSSGIACRVTEDLATVAVHALVFQQPADESVYAFPR